MTTAPTRDFDGNLDTVVVEMLDSSGNTLDSVTNNVSGSSASGVDEVRSKSNGHGHRRHCDRHRQRQRLRFAIHLSRDVVTDTVSRSSFSTTGCGSVPSPPE